MQKFRENPSRDSLVTGHDVTFREFSLYILGLWAQHKLVSGDGHWMRYEDLCQPCAIQYDYIGKYETLEQDAEHILSRLNLTHLVQFPHRGSEYSGKRTIGRMQEYYSSLPRELALMLGHVFSNDSAMFGYPTAAEVLRETGAF